MEKPLSIRLVIFKVLCIGAFLSFGFAPMTDGSGNDLIPQGEVNLPVHTILQSQYTSCGEAAFVMAYNYAYPETQLSEQAVIEYAVSEGYYTERKLPFTSPENMVNIANHYASTVSTGTVQTAEEGLAFLANKLSHGDPVIIDVIARLYDPKSAAHFVVVTGMSIDPANPNATKFYFNDPLTGTNRWGYWEGGEGIWNAWQNNGDPGGSGWWMVISSP